METSLNTLVKRKHELIKELDRIQSMIDNYNSLSKKPIYVVDVQKKLGD